MGGLLAVRASARLGARYRWHGAANPIAMSPHPEGRCAIRSTWASWRQAQYHRGGEAEPAPALPNKNARSRPGIFRQLPLSIQRELGRIAAQIRRRVERLAVDRAVDVFARERRIAELRREGVVLELAVARQHFRAGIEPRARGDEDAGARALLVGAVGTVRPVIGAAVPVVFLLGLGVGRSRAERDEGAAAASNIASLLAAGNFRVIASSSLSALAGAGRSPNLIAGIVATAGPSSLGQLRHTAPE